MVMPPGIRRFALTAHVAASVGWLGAVAAFLALALAGLTGEDVRRAQGAYLAMETAGWFVVVPLAFASLLTGVVQALGTRWGLVRHYWVLVKLALTLVATGLLVLHMQVVEQVADAAASGLPGPGLEGARLQLVLDAGAAVLVLLIATAVSVYKPRGLTRYGWRAQRAQRRERGEAAGDAAARAVT